MSNTKKNMRIKPTKQELDTIQELIYENYSFTYIGKQTNMNDKTVKSIIENYNLDISKYDKRVAAGKGKKKHLSDEDFSLILDNIKNGVSLRQIVKNFPVTYPTLRRILDEKGVEYKKYKRSSPNKFNLNDSDLQCVKDEIARGIKIKDLSKKYNVNRNTFSSYLKEVGVINFKSNINDSVRDFIIKSHNEYLTIGNIHLITKVDKTTISEIINTHGNDISEKDKYKNNQNGGLSNSPHNLILKLKEFGEINGVTSLINEKDVVFLLDNISHKPYFEIVKDLNVDYKELRHFVIVMGKKEVFSYDNLITYKYSDEFISDLSDGRKSNSQVAFKYGVSYESISSWRRKMFGEIKSYYDPRFSQTTLEMKFELILNSLDIAFLREYIVDGLKFDYYLGHKLLIELHGDYWHTKDNNDEVKTKISSDMGYRLIVINEEDVNHNPNNIKELLFNEYISAIKKQYEIN